VVLVAIDAAAFRYGSLSTAVITFVAVAAAILCLVVTPVTARGEGPRGIQPTKASAATRSFSRRSGRT
jgi:hypothetical protein